MNVGCSFYLQACICIAKQLGLCCFFEFSTSIPFYKYNLKVFLSLIKSMKGKEVTSPLDSMNSCPHFFRGQISPSHGRYFSQDSHMPHLRVQQLACRCMQLLSCSHSALEIFKEWCRCFTSFWGRGHVDGE